MSWKPFPTGRAAHGGLVATKRLSTERAVAAGTLERLTYVAPPLIQRLVGRRATAGMSPAYARLCLPYLAAVMLVRGSVGLDDFSSERLAEPEVLMLAQRITVKVDANPDPGAFTPAVAVALTRDGAIHRVEVASQLGSPAQPLTPGSSSPRRAPAWVSQAWSPAIRRWLTRCRPSRVPSTPRRPAHRPGHAGRLNSAAPDAAFSGDRQVRRALYTIMR